MATEPIQASQLEQLVDPKTGRLTALGYEWIEQMRTATVDNTSGKEDLGASAINTQTGTSYTLVLADAGKIVEMNNANANTLTVPPQSSVEWPDGARVDLAQIGAGQTTIAAGGGVTIRSADGNLKLRVQYSLATLYRRAENEWVLGGDLDA